MLLEQPLFRGLVTPFTCRLATPSTCRLAPLRPDEAEGPLLLPALWESPP